MLYRISVAERGLTGIANIFRSRLSRLDDLLRAGTVPARTGAGTVGFGSYAKSDSRRFPDGSVVGGR